MDHDRRSEKPAANKNSAEKFSRIKEKEGWLYKANDITFNKKKKLDIKIRLHVAVAVEQQWQLYCLVKSENIVRTKVLI